MSLLASYPINEQGRDFAVGDIHGHFSVLKAGLRAIGFDGNRDRLFSVGDLVDRGPESALAARWLAQPWFHAIRGNHEAMACAAVTGDDDAAELNLSNGGEWLLEMPEAERQGLIGKLLKLPLAMEVATAAGVVGMVHADMPFDDWQAFAKEARSGLLSERDRDMCLWSIARHARRYAQPVERVRAVVHGHITVPRMEVLGNTYFIDTHHSSRPAGQQGHFTFLELGTLQAHDGPGGDWVKPPSRNR